MRIFLSCCLVIAAVLASSSTASAGLLDPLLQHRSFPQCHDTKVLGKIVERFNWAEDNTWHRGFYLMDIDRIRERTVLGHGYGEPTHAEGYDAPPAHERLIPRRYCRAHALLTNGRHPTLFYLIEGGQGFAGNGFNVEFCINGLDPWREYDGSCRVLRH